MATFKRGKTFWTDFTHDGTRYRESLKTTNWQVALKKERNRIEEIRRGENLASDRHLAKGSFNQAADRYLESRKLDLAIRSLAKERESLVAPRRAFGSLPLMKIKPDTVRSYLIQRKEAGLSNATLNMERGAIVRVMKLHKRHRPFLDELKPLKVETSTIGRALTDEEQATLLRVALQRTDSLGLRCAIVLALNTTMRSVELKHLRWQDVDLLERVVTVRRSKTDAGKREIPLNNDAFVAVVQLRGLSQEEGHARPDHYVFPACENGNIDPFRPQKTWRTAWRTVTRAVNCPVCRRLQAPADSCRNLECKADMRGIKSPLAGLRFHDLRHSSITMLAEGNASEQTIRSIAGHLSWRMLEHYSHIRKEAKVRALAAICKPKSTSVAVIARARKSGSAPLMAQTTAQKLLGAGEGNPN
ncbi:MAG: tyrosine-type recombinase/integrase [Terriglobia bacterium]